MKTRRFLATLSLAGIVLVSMHATGAALEFGAKLTNQTEPANARQGMYCAGTQNPNGMCTWVLMQALGCEFGNCLNGHLAPANGTIGTVRLVACTTGTFVLQIAKQVNPKTQVAEVARSGPLINYAADPNQCNGDTFKVQSFAVNVPVLKNEYLAVATDQIDFISCSGGSNNMLGFAPPLPDGGGLRKSSFGSGCFMLLEAIYK